MEKPKKKKKGKKREGGGKGDGKGPQTARDGELAGEQRPPEGHGVEQLGSSWDAMNFTFA